MVNITTEEVMDKIDIFQARFGKLDEFSWWDIERVKIESCTQFTSKEFQEGISVHGSQLALAPRHHQEMNACVEVTWKNGELSQIQLQCTHGFLKNI